MRYWWLSAISIGLMAISAQAQVAGDAPPQGDPEDYANYYLGVERKGLEPFWKASVNMPKHQSEFVMNYRDVRQKKDKKLLEEIIHPASKACETEDRADYFATIREFYLNEHFPETFKIKFFSLAEEKRWPLKQRLEFPAAPTHIMYIEYKDGEYIEGLQRFVREEDYPEKRFYELVKCPSETSMAKMRAEAESRLAEEEKASN